MAREKDAGQGLCKVGQQVNPSVLFALSLSKGHPSCVLADEPFSSS